MNTPTLSPISKQSPATLVNTGESRSSGPEGGSTSSMYLSGLSEQAVQQTVIAASPARKYP